MTKINDGGNYVAKQDKTYVDNSKFDNSKKVKESLEANSSKKVNNSTEVTKDKSINQKILEKQNIQEKLADNFEKALNVEKKVDKVNQKETKDNKDNEYNDYLKSEVEGILLEKGIEKKGELLEKVAEHVEEKGLKGALKHAKSKFRDGLADMDDKVLSKAKEFKSKAPKVIKSETKKFIQEARKDISQLDDKMVEGAKSLKEAPKVISSKAKNAVKTVSQEVAEKGVSRVSAKGLGKIASNIVKRAGPIANAIGGILDFKEKVDEGKSVKRAAIETAGSVLGGVAAGAAAGALAGSVVPGIGTAIGAVVGTGIAIAGSALGSMAGEKIASKIADWMGT